MYGKKKRTKKSKKSLEKCHISTPNELKIVRNKESQKYGGSLVYADKVDGDVYEKWPMPVQNIPYIYIHRIADYAKHVRRLLAMDIHFYEPVLCPSGAKIGCPHFEYHQALIQYFNQKRIPYHTFGHPSKRKLKVVIRGFTNDVDMNEIKSELKGGALPVIRIHKMHKRKNIKDDTKPLYMVVVPNDEEGRKLLLIKQILGVEVELEPVKLKTQQCYRCQKWGHSQRYCRGEIKCVKCAKRHYSSKCDRNPKDPIKCANCGQEGHVASWRNCPCCPDSDTYKSEVLKKFCRHTVILKDGTLHSCDECSH